MVVVNGVSQANRVWVNNGSGTFIDSGQSLGSSSSSDLALGDVDGDGDLDMVVTNLNQGNRIWLNNGSGNYTDSGQSLGSSASVTVSLGDVDGDGDLDMVVANYNQGNRVWLNDGSGGYTASGQSLGSSSSHGVSLGDVDSDGDLDMVVANHNQGNRVWLNDGSGNYTDSGQSLGVFSGRDISLGDVDGDGDLDMVVANFLLEGNRVWLNDGSGNYTDGGQSLGASTSLDLSLGDVDGDGDLDMAVANFNGQANRIWLNDGGGNYTDSGLLLGSSNTEGVSLGDVDGDGSLDAVFGNDTSQANTVWLNSAQPVITDTVVEPRFQINSQTSNDQTTAQVATLYSGNVIVVWSNGVHFGQTLSARLLDSTGTPLPGPIGDQFQIGLTGAIQQDVAALPGGGFVVAWATGGGAGQVFMQRFDANGAAVDVTPQSVNSGSAPTGNPEIAVLPDGSFLITYYDDGSAGHATNARYYSSAGVGGAEFAVADEPGGQGGGHLALLSNGNVAVVDGVNLLPFSDNDNREIFLDIIQPDGTPVAGPIQVNTTTADAQIYADVATLGNDRFVVIWDDSNPAVPDVLGQIFNNDGSTFGSEFVVNSTTAGNQSTQDVVSLPDGGFFVTWQSDTLPDGSPAGSWGLLGQRFDSTGQSVGSEMVIDQGLSQTFGTSPEMTVLANGSIFMAFSGQFSTDTDPDHAIAGRVISLNDSVGTDGNDTLISGLSDSVLTGGLGDDVFVLTNGSGNDTITDFAAGPGIGDIIDVSDFNTNFATLIAGATDIGADVLIPLDGDDSLTLLGVNIANLNADDFIF